MSLIYCVIEFNLFESVNRTLFEVFNLFLFLFFLFEQSDTMKVLWSFGDTDPIHGNLKGHGSNRGAKPLHLLNPLFRKPTHNRDIKQWDVTVKNVSRRNKIRKRWSFYGETNKVFNFQQTLNGMKIHFMRKIIVY